MMLSAAGDEKIYCPYCRTISNFDFPFHTRTYYHCPSCDLIFRSNRGSEDREALVRYYESRYFSEQAHDQLDGARNELYSQILDRIEKKTVIGQLLDVGCGCGFFLKEAEKRGWEVAGVDPSEESIIYCEKLLGKGVADKGTLEHFSKGKLYDVITMINVLDHFTEPWAEIKRARLLLKPKGVIFLRFPNGVFHSTLYKISKIFRFEDFMKIFLIFHEYSFTPKFIRRLLSDCGFADVMVYNASLTGGPLAKPHFVLRYVAGVTELAGRMTDLASGGRFPWGPSLEVIARN